MPAHAVSNTKSSKYSVDLHARACIIVGMANNLPTEKKVLAVSMLAEGNSIRSIERITEIHRDTVMRLGVRVGQVLRSDAEREDA